MSHSTQESMSHDGHRQSNTSTDLCLLVWHTWCSLPRLHLTLLPHQSQLKSESRTREMEEREEGKHKGRERTRRREIHCYSSVHNVYKQLSNGLKIITSGLTFSNWLYMITTIHEIDECLCLHVTVHACLTLSHRHRLELQLSDKDSQSSRHDMQPSLSYSAFMSQFKNT